MNTVNKKVKTLASTLPKAVVRRIFPTFPPLIDVVVPNKVQWGFWRRCFESPPSPREQASLAATSVRYPPGLNWDGVICYFCLYCGRRGYTWSETEAEVRRMLAEAPILQKAARNV